MSEPTQLALIKPEEGVRAPELLDDSKLLGVLDVITRFQIGEIDSVDLANTLDTFAAVIRQILCGESPSGSYLKYPAKSIKEMSDLIDSLLQQEFRINTVELTALEPISRFDFVRVAGDYAMSLAVGDAPLHARTIGCLLVEDADVGDVGVVGVSGKVIQGILTNAHFGDKYYLDTSIPGKITNVVPMTKVQLEVGSALNSTDLLLDIKIPFNKKV